MHEAIHVVHLDRCDPHIANSLLEKVLRTFTQLIKNVDNLY